MKEQPYYPFRIGFLLSGNGSTLENLLKSIQKRKLHANVVTVISSRSQAYGLKRAERWQIPHSVVPFQEFKNDILKYSQKITETLVQYQVDLVVLGGFLSPYFVPKLYQNKVVNIHPSLLPAFGGKGYYGHRVHQAVLERGVKISGCTVHFVDQNYDQGPILAQASLEVRMQDTPKTLQARIQKLENKLYPQTIQAILENRIHHKGNQLWIQGSKNSFFSSLFHRKSKALN